MVDILCQPMVYRYFPSSKLSTVLALWGIYFKAQTNDLIPFARSATSLMRSITSLRSTSFARSATSFICAARAAMKLSQGSNDVACTTQMMLCLMAQMKKIQVLRLGFFGWDGWARTIEMPESKSGALPLGYIPITLGILSYSELHVKNKIKKLPRNEKTT